MTNPTRAAAAVKRVLGDDSSVIAVYIFGSTAIGRANASSDVDVAVLFAEDLTAKERFGRVLEIGIALESEIGTEIDVVDLRCAPPLLGFRVIQTGLLAVEHDRLQRCLFQVRTMNVYYDSKRYLDSQRAASIRRIQQEGLGRGYRGNRDALAEARRLRETLAATPDGHSAGIHGR